MSDSPRAPMHLAEWESHPPARGLCVHSLGLLPGVALVTLHLPGGLGDGAWARGGGVPNSVLLCHVSQ